MKITKTQKTRILKLHRDIIKAFLEGNSVRTIARRYEVGEGWVEASIRVAIAAIYDNPRNNQ